MENLPEEMVTEILSRLPAESLIQCKLVRKSWYRLFTNPNFISKHVAHQHQSNSNPNLVFLKRRVSCLDEPKREIMCLLSSDNVDDPEIVNVSSSIQLPRTGSRLIGHCDGLIALSDNRDGITVCNFTTREFRTLPNSSFGLIPYDAVVTRVDDSVITRFRAFNPILGFGYDSKIKDYKIVRVGPDKDEFNHRVEVFSIRTDSCWRELDVVFDSSLTLPWDFKIREPYLDGAYYWWVRNYENLLKSVLLSFHMADEVFVKIPMPTLACFNDLETEVSVGSYNKTMALFILSGRDPGRIDIWVMKEFGVEESWSKQHTIDPFVGRAHLGFWNGTDEFLYVDRDRQIAIYNRVTKQSKILSLPGVSETWVATPYMKTIVSVKAVDNISLLLEDLANVIF